MLPAVEAMSAPGAHHKEADVSRAWKVVLAVAAVGTMVGTVVLAQGDDATKEQHQRGGGGPRGGWFKTMDTDTNGTVSLSEFTIAHEKRLADRKARMGDKWDAEKAAKMPTPEERFKKLDADGNGELTKDEMKKARGNRGPGDQKPGDDKSEE